MAVAESRAPAAEGRGPRPGHWSHRAARWVALSGIALALAACGAQESAGPDVAGGASVSGPVSSVPAGGAQVPAPDPWLLAPGSGRMALQLGGLLVPLANGMRVPAGNGLAAELFFAPYPPAGRTNLDVYVVDERSGAALADVQVALRYEMPDMEHGIVFQPAEPRGNGHHLLALNLAMAGNWQLAVQMTRPGQRGEIQLVTTVLAGGR